MTARDGGHERIYRGLLRLYPSPFRARFADEMVQLFGDQLRDARAGGRPAGTARTWLRTLTDLAVTAAAEHTQGDRTMAESLATAPSTTSRLLGLVGILGGAILVAVFFVTINPDLNPLRLALFNAGALAIVIGVHMRQASASPALALVAAVPALLANAWYLAMVVLATGQPRPFAGDFGLVWFVAAAVMWLSDAWFGLVTMKLGVVTRWGALALAIGSLLAFTGVDRLALTSPANPTIFGPLALAGVALNGLGWIFLGIDVATRRIAPQAQQHGDDATG